MGLELNHAILGQSPTRSLDPVGRIAGAALAETPTIRVLRGRDAVARMAEMLQELCQRTGQDGAMDCLDYLLHTPTALEKTPTLVLVGLDAGVDATRATADDVVGAVLLYEYRVAGMGMRVFATDDTTGERTVIAPMSLRAKVADAACRSLMKRSALAVLISFESMAEADDAVETRAGLSAEERGAVCWMAKQRRAVPRSLPLEESLEATLATLGRRTRRNLRYYRRRVEREVGTAFVPHVAMQEDEFLGINRKSINPTPDAVAAWRYSAIQQTPGALFAGVRARDGRWLSLIGGRRQLQVTEIDWQMNLAGPPRNSLSTVMLSYMLEREINLGTKKLAFRGGTPHSMRHSFVSVDAVDVIAQRRSATAWLLRKLSRWILPEKNFLGQALRDGNLRWTKW
jgi:hypothetical protein